MTLETIDSVLVLKPFAKAKHCWVCTIILRDKGHKHASVFNRRYADTNCCERCVTNGGEKRKEKWLYTQLESYGEDKDMTYAQLDNLYKELLSGIKYY